MRRMGRWAKRGTLVLLLVAAGAAAGADRPAHLVKNINQTIDRRGSSSTYAFTPAGPYIYFLAADSTHAPELWRSDRTPAGTVPWRELGFAPELSDASQILALGDDLIAIGDGVWRTDGTAAGTVQLANGDGWWAVESNRTVFLFRGDELWRSDGSPSGTRSLANLGSRAGETRTVQNLAVAGGRIFFTFCNDRDACELWFSDCAPNRTRRVTHLPLSSYGPGIQDFFAAGSGLFMNRCIDGQCELWHSDGSSAGTWHLPFSPPPPTDYGWDGVRHLVVAGEGVFFTGCDRAAGCEPWHSDGTIQGTRRLADIDPGPDSGLPEPDDEVPEFAVVDGVLYFPGYAPRTGVELWRSDGSPSGTHLVKDINPGSADGFIKLYDFFTSYSAVFTVLDHALYFAASDGLHGFELWRTDGTAKGTVMVADAVPGSAGVFDFISKSENCEDSPQRVAVGTTLWFVGCTPNEDRETWQLWRSDGTGAGTGQLEDGIDSRFLAAAGDGVLFAWFDEQNQTEALGRRDVANAVHHGSAGEHRRVDPVPARRELHAAQPGWRHGAVVDRRHAVGYVPAARHRRPGCERVAGRPDRARRPAAIQRRRRRARSRALAQRCDGRGHDAGR
jgi:ELWxxDGT repeat protein